MRVLLTIVFSVWSTVGLLINGVQLIAAHGLYELGVGTSAALIMDISFWVGGSMIFGLGAILLKDVVLFPQSPRPAPEPWEP